jgi:cobalt/nickel transport protein
MNKVATDKKKFYVIGIFVTLILAGVVSFYASSSPDGLEKVAGEIGFIDTAKDHALAQSPLADYGLKGVENERLSVGIAGVIGVLATGAVSTGLFFILRRKSN